MYMYYAYCVTGSQAFSVFSPEVFEQAMNVFKVLNTSGTAYGLADESTLELFYVCVR